jgi:hypothetical protein
VPDDAAGQLGEDERLVRGIHAALGGMIGIVEPDANDLCITANRRPKLYGRQWDRLSVGHGGQDVGSSGNDGIAGHDPDTITPIEGVSGDLQTRAPDSTTNQ